MGIGYRQPVPRLNGVRVTGAFLETVAGPGEHVDQSVLWNLTLPHQTVS